MDTNDPDHSQNDSSFAIEEELDKDSERTSASLSSSTASSPLPVESLGPIFQVKFRENECDSSEYTIHVSRLDNPEDRDKWWDVQRSYDDFSHFNWQLLNSQKFEGVIFPPLPSKMDSKQEYEYSQLWPIHHKQTERYLQLVCSHPVLGHCQLLAEFLSTTYTPPKGKANKRGFLSKFAENFSNKKPSHKDIEDFFQNERDWVTVYSSSLKNVLSLIQTVTDCEKKISGQLKHLCTALSMNVPSCEEIDLINYQLLAMMAEAFLCMKDQTDIHIQTGLCHLYSTLDFYNHYIQNEETMLNRRIGLLIDYENANCNWDKAKANKKDEAEVVKKAAEQTFEECSDVARHEIKSFQKQRVIEMRSSFTHFARNELQNARKMKALLSEALQRTRQFHIPNV